VVVHLDTEVTSAENLKKEIRRNNVEAESLLKFLNLASVFNHCEKEGPYGLSTGIRGASKDFFPGYDSLYFNDRQVVTKVINGDMREGLVVNQEKSQLYYMQFTDEGKPVNGRKRGLYLWRIPMSITQKFWDPRESQNDNEEYDMFTKYNFLLCIANMVLLIIIAVFGYWTLTQSLIKQRNNIKTEIIQSVNASVGKTVSDKFAAHVESVSPTVKIITEIKETVDKLVDDIELIKADTDKIGKLTNDGKKLLGIIIETKEDTSKIGKPNDSDSNETLFNKIEQMDKKIQVKPQR